MPTRRTPTSTDAAGAGSRRDTAPDPEEIARPTLGDVGRADTFIDENEKPTGKTSGSGVRHVEGLDYDDVGETTVEPSGETNLVDYDDVGATDAGSGEHEVRRPASAVDSFEAPAEGDTVDGRYVIERVIGRGASGVVYEATHRVIGKRLAIKCLHPQIATSPVAVQRLFREARISAGLRHPNIIEVFDAGRDGDLYYLTMELLEGEPLGAYLTHELRTIEEIVRLFLGIMDGVAAVHDAGVVHRDLKPDNVFLVMGEEGLLVPKVLDFGVSKLYEPGRQQITTVGMMMGTPYYMAPEQVTDSRGDDARADVYSIGVMLYEALSGKVPYDGESLLEVFNRSLEGRPVPLRELRPDVPPGLEALIARAMCAERSVRYADMHEMRTALAAVRIDGTDDPDDWSDVSEPWMLDPNAGQLVKPLEAAPTQVAAIQSGTTVQMNEPPGEPAARNKTIEWTAPPTPPRASNQHLLIVAGTAGIVVALGTAAAILWALLS